MLPGALAARLGGDEFCLLTVGPAGRRRGAGRATNSAHGRRELELGDGVACGVASTGDPIGPVRSARRLFRLADAAQYRAKAARAGGAGGRRAGTGPDDPVVRLADGLPGRTSSARFRATDRRRSAVARR